MTAPPTHLFTIIPISREKKMGMMLEKISISSIARSMFTGTLKVFRNREHPLFKVERRLVEEQFFPSENLNSSRLVSDASSWKYFFCLMANFKVQPRQWVIVAQATGLALRNIDHLLPREFSANGRQGEIDFYWAETPAEKQGASSVSSASPGFWAVRGEHLHLVLARWEEAVNGSLGHRSDIEIWNDVVSALPLRKSLFEKGEIYAPRIGSVDWQAVSNAAFVTVPNWPEKEQWKFLQSLYFGTYFGDETGLMLNILDP